MRNECLLNASNEDNILNFLTLQEKVSILLVFTLGVMLKVFLKNHDFDPAMLIRVMLIKKACYQ